MVWLLCPTLWPFASCKALCLVLPKKVVKFQLEEKRDKIKVAFVSKWEHGSMKYSSLYSKTANFPWCFSAIIFLANTLAKLSSKDTLPSPSHLGSNPSTPHCWIFQIFVSTIVSNWQFQNVIFGLKSTFFSWIWALLCLKMDNRILDWTQNGLKWTKI